VLYAPHCRCLQFADETAYLEDVERYREYLEDLLIKNRVKLLVATIALGMGFDKPDIGFVVHFQVCVKTEFLYITTRLAEMSCAVMWT